VSIQSGREIDVTGDDRRASWGALVAPAIVFVALSVAITFPLVLRLSTGVPHDLGDPLLSASILWWNAHVTPLTAPWWHGSWFHPESGSLAFSDHRLGASLFASPLQWLGVTPVAAANLTLLASFALSALAAFVLVLELTGRSDAALVSGLAFGFNPYRMAHIEHLELLLAFALPLALWTLHRYERSGRARWLIALVVMLVWLGLCSSYYLLFFGVLGSSWVVWFLRWRDWRRWVAVASAYAAAALILAPVYVRLAAIHRQYGFSRGVDEIALYGADVTSFVTASPMIALWGWTASLNGPERQTFPGVGIAVLAMAGAVVAAASREVVRDRLSRVARVFAGLAMAALLLGSAAWLFGPFHVDFGSVRLLSVDVFFKPLSVSLLAATLGLGFSARLRDARCRRSLLAFYGLAAALLVLLSLGPRPKLLGVPILYQPPYSWLMVLPGFADGVRVPARFTMLAVLALSVAAGLGYLRWRPRSIPPAAWLTIILVVIAADTWPHPFPIAEAPRR